jgi:hypothetical protein
MTGHLVSRFDQVGEQVFAVIAGPRTRQDEGSALAQAGWRELAVPTSCVPPAGRANLDGSRTHSGWIQSARRVRSGRLARLLRPAFARSAPRLALARPLAEATLAGVRGRGGLAALSAGSPNASWTPCAIR